jgi:hypothetical protein
MSKICIAALFFFASVSTIAAAQTAEPAATPAPSIVPTDGAWHYAVTPYLWLPNINGSFSFRRNTILPNPPSVPPTVTIGMQVGPSSYLANLNFAILASFEARRKYLSIFGDYMNLNLSSTVANVRTITGPLGKVEIPISSNVSTHLFSGLFTLGVGVTAAANSDSNLDFGIGVRNATLRSNADYSLAGPITQIPISGNLSASETLTDAIAVMRGRIGTGSRWYFPFYGDVGTGNSNTTWQYLFGAAYGGRTTDVILAYRNLGYNGTDDRALQQIRMGGPLLGVRIHW